MKSRIRSAAVLVLSFAVAGLAAPVPVRAMSIGFYGSGGLGSTDWQEQDRMNFEDRQDTRHSGAGIVLGTGFHYNPLSYRLSIGWEQTTMQGDFDRPDGKLKGVVIDQDITLDLVGGSGPLSFWVGPELRLGFLHGSPEGGDTGDDDFLVLGLGPVIGADFILSPSLGVSWKLGYLVSQYAGSRRSSTKGEDSFVDGHAYASLAILFSTSGGYYEQRQQQTYQAPQPQLLEPLPPPQPPPPPPGYPRPWYPQPW
jgi:hypothetical protein